MHPTTPSLPPFSGWEKRCPKCGADGPRALYRLPLRPGALLAVDSGQQRRGPLPERLERECATCSYTWDEALAEEPPQ
ncbi:hypothetical protein [Streptomyces sp. SID11385]|uniref:hypothetical protein n=1 Tax=Streptomyces sp. SID11385 TaxID=2706031 RepID=UPI0013C63D80|nr:hypothetical protein [Streptomyces sp. SID11385]NEA42744.1 hypothetical protein [Streptomyces sp. SID11385]